MNNHINFLPQTWLYKYRLQKAKVRWIIVLTTLSCLLTAISIFAHINYTPDTHTLALKRQSLSDRITNLEKQKATLQKNMTILETHLLASEKIKKSPNWNTLFDRISSCIPNDAQLTFFSVTPEYQESASGLDFVNKYIFKLQGITLSQENSSNIVLALEDLNIFDDVKLISTSAHPINNNIGSKFSIVCFTYSANPSNS